MKGRYKLWIGILTILLTLLLYTNEYLYLIPFIFLIPGILLSNIIGTVAALFGCKINSSSSIYTATSKDYIEEAESITGFFDKTVLYTFVLFWICYLIALINEWSDRKL